MQRLVKGTVDWDDECLSDFKARCAQPNKPSPAWHSKPSTRSTCAARSR